jgi:hypothetical protein
MLLPLLLHLVLCCQYALNLEVARTRDVHQLVGTQPRTPDTPSDLKDTHGVLPLLLLPFLACLL